MSTTMRVFAPFALILVVGCSAGGETAAASFDRPPWMDGSADAEPAVPDRPEAAEAPAPDSSAEISPPRFEVPPIPVPGRPIESDADVRAVYDDLVAAGYAIGADPDPERVKDVWAEVCPCYEYFRQHVEGMVNSQEYAISPLPEVIAFEVVNRAENKFQVNVTRRGRGGKTFDSSGNLVKESLPGEPEPLHAFAAIVEGGWRFVVVGQGHL